MAHKDPSHEDISEMIQAIESKLRSHQAKYIKPTDYSNFGIKCTDMDITTGVPIDGVPKFSSLSRQEVAAVLEETRPWLDRKYTVEAETGYLAALGINYFLRHWLHWVDDADYGNGTVSLIERTKWQERPMITQIGETLYDYNEKYVGASIMDMDNNMVPHITCHIVGDTELQDDCLLRCEVLSLLSLTLGRLYPKCYSTREFIPVTLLSGSSREVRVVQGFLDHDSGKLCVRKTRIIDMTSNTERKENAILLLSWLVADPVGVKPAADYCVWQKSSQAQPAPMPIPTKRRR